MRSGSYDGYEGEDSVEELAPARGATTLHLATGKLPWAVGEGAYRPGQAFHDSDGEAWPL